MTTERCEWVLKCSLTSPPPSTLIGPTFQLLGTLQNQCFFMKIISPKMRRKKRCRKVSAPFVLRMVRFYYDSYVCTTNGTFVLRTVRLYYECYVCTTNGTCVPRTVRWYYERCICSTNGTIALRTIRLYYARYVCTTNGTFVLRTVRLYYERYVCTTNGTLTTKAPFANSLIGRGRNEPFVSFKHIIISSLQVVNSVRWHMSTFASAK